MRDLRVSADGGQVVNQPMSRLLYALKLFQEFLFQTFQASLVITVY
jgi:hypothetical protein